MLEIYNIAGDAGVS